MTVLVDRAMKEFTERRSSDGGQGEGDTEEHEDPSTGTDDPSES